MAKSVLTLDEINLLKNSEELKNKSLYGNLYEILQSLAVKKAISLEELSTLDNKAIATLTYNKKTMIDTVIKEWFAERVSDQDSSKKVRCGLCNTPNKYIYYIRNRKNDILLNVGSHCITKFPGIEGYIEQKNQLKQMEKNQKITQRRLEFFERFSYPDKIIDNAEKYFSELPILLPYELYHNLQDTIKRMRLIFSQYINEGKKPYQSNKDSFELFQTAIEYFNKLKKQADEHVSNNQYKEYICKRSEIDWIINMKNFQLLDKIANNNGFYTKETISKIYSYSFIKNNYQLLKERNRSLMFNFTKMNDNSFVLNYEKRGYSPYLSFTLIFENIAKEILPNCIFEEKYFYNETNLLPYIKIDTTYDNLMSIINYTLDVMLNINYVFLFDESINTLILYRIVDGAIRTFSIVEFIQAYSKYIIKSDSVIKNYLISLVKGTKNTKWSNKIQQEKHGVYQKISSLYYRQYVDTDVFYQKHSSTKDLFIEIPVYNSEYSSGELIINYNTPQFIKIEKKSLHLSYRRYNHIDYGIIINDNSFEPFYKKSDVILIHQTKSLHNTGIGLFVINNKVVIRKYHIFKDEQEKTNTELFLINDKQSIKTSILYKKDKILGDILCYVRNIK